MGQSMPWRAAMTEALYGERGFYVGERAGGGGGHFRTSAHASPLFATAVLRMVVAVDEALGRPDPLDVVDIGAGGAHLLRRLALLAPAYLGRRLRLTAIELADRPPDVPGSIGWQDELPPPASVSGVVLATEWLDNVALDIAEIDADGVPRYVLVEPSSGLEEPGDALADDDAEWATRWWSDRPWEPGLRIELGWSRDDAWASAVETLAQGVAMTVDYGHMWFARPPLGTLAGFRAGRATTAVPDGSCDITAHVAIDAACAAGEAVAGQPGVLITQREALTSLGLDGSRPPLGLANHDPAGYVRALSAATQATDLLDTEGLGGHYWIVQPVGSGTEVLPTGMRHLAPA